MKKSWATFVLATALIGLTGCADNNNNATNNNIDNMGTNVRNNGNMGVNVRNVSNQNLRVSSKAGRNVENLKEVDLAHVIIRNNDAYVAVKLHNNQHNHNGIGGDTNANNNLGTPSLTDTNRSGSALNPGTAGAGVNGTNNGTAGIRDTGMNDGTTGIGGNGTNNVNNGNNGTTNDANFNKASTRLEKEIAKQVHAADTSIDNVYISYDTNFFDQMTNYSNDLRHGRNRDGLWNDFTNTMNRNFR